MTDAVAEAYNRANLCRFIAACYYEPTSAFVEEKLFDSMAFAADVLEPELGMSARRLGEFFTSEGQDSLLVDYTRLFLGPNNILAQPYGSVWLEGEKKLMQDSTMQVIEFYETGGFELSNDFRELPDHITAELEFLYLLIYRQGQAQVRKDHAQVESVRQLRKRFLTEHLSRWVGPFTEAIQRNASTRFYAELGRFTNAFVAGELARMAE